MVTVMYDSKQIHIAKTTNWHLHTDLNAKAGQEMVTRYPSLGCIASSIRGDSATSNGHLLSIGNPDDMIAWRYLERVMLTFIDCSACT